MGAQCVPAALVPRQRRRRFPERELLERIRQYETLLRQHHVPFRPLHPPHTPVDVPSERPPSSRDGRTPEPPRIDDSAPSGQGKRVKPRTTNLWHALRRTDADTEDDSDTGSEADEPGGGFIYDNEDMEKVIKAAFDRAYRSGMESSSPLLLGSPASTTPLTSLHPDQATIFRLWQVYLDNVNPLLKVTHTPSLQPRIIDAMGDLANISAPLEALLFAIYCTSIMSLSEDQCRTLFGSARRNLLTGYQFACRQALSSANLLQSCDHDCLVALFLYLVSIKSDTDPRSVSSMLAVAIHIAQRMNYDKESSNEKYPILEAEMRRRLWWSLVILNSRVCETFNYRAATMAPTWDCRTPSNFNDFELLSGSRTAPPVHDKPTEALFVCVRSQISDFIRHCPFHLEPTDPFLATLAGGGTSHYDLRELQETVEKTLSLCDPAHPLHYMTMWTARGILAKNMLLEHCFRRRRRQHQQQQQQQQQQLGSDLPDKPDPDEPDPAIGYAVTMLRCDTALLASPLTRGFLWYVHAHFPFLAYVYLAQYLPSLAATTAAAEAGESGVKERNNNNNNNNNNNDNAADVVSAAWAAMSDNYDARRAADFFSFPSEEKDQNKRERERNEGGRDGATPGSGEDSHPLFVLFARVVLGAWDAVAAAFAAAGHSRDVEEAVPRIVVSLRERLGKEGAGIEERGGGSGLPSGGGSNGNNNSIGGDGGNAAGGSCNNTDTGIVNTTGDSAAGYGFTGAYMDVLLGDGGIGLVDVECQQVWPTMDWAPLVQHGF
ncbi:hypothetical protein MYCTH_2303243 [Thermothelomyces thermophilus ATCC 42464]|uniref:Xylanolytic transcriptional activator regulatory domain-containing protein n=1 Tax=Thermothelomyces thermophilus (strain ATCC 42464 / BCRC 31852 / DSM 1799) TaxID=573729 RepID=G2QCA5_THET4|nr:uncharacterized protein MYCTH_2303243 [Thermothelomyces thermophilus ATCC 42464]AEO57280.1 hypothetical protein MYCTH_2303243 [Thermothelomyces thermophilus ATCC 42464]